MLPDPLFVLAPPRSFTSVVCGKLGQHPQMYGLPEVNLSAAETLGEMWGFYSRRRFGRDGLLRAVAQLYSGHQTVQTIMLAQRWVQIRLRVDTGTVFRELAEKANGAVLVDKSPINVLRVEYLYRLRKAFPRARFIHLIRHPRAMGESVLKIFGNTMLIKLGSFDYSTEPPTIDPQKTWYTMHVNTLMFLETVPREQQMRVLGEDLLSDPDTHLREIAGWMGLRTDEAAIEQMLHPERSPFACFGPPNARFGGDPNFLGSPALKRSKGKRPELDGPLPWRPDGGELSAEVKELARQFGYK
jgi:hypothetical protein